MTQERRGATIAIAGLRKEYGEGRERVVALGGINLTIVPGEFCCIVGPSGCGKSTLLRILAGLARATRGTIDVHATGAPVPTPNAFPEHRPVPSTSARKNDGV